MTILFVCFHFAHNHDTNVPVSIHHSLTLPRALLPNPLFLPFTRRRIFAPSSSSASAHRQRKGPWPPSSPCGAHYAWHSECELASRVRRPTDSTGVQTRGERGNKDAGTNVRVFLPLFPHPYPSVPFLSKVYLRSRLCNRSICLYPSWTPTRTAAPTSTSRSKRQTERRRLGGCRRSRLNARTHAGVSLVE